MSGKFLYFAYGSNLWSKRIHINNPSAVRVGIGKLKVRYFIKKANQEDLKGFLGL